MILHTIDIKSTNSLLTEDAYPLSYFEYYRAIDLKAGIGILV